MPQKKPIPRQPMPEQDKYIPNKGKPPAGWDNPIKPKAKNEWESLPFLPNKELGANSDMSRSFYGLEHDPKRNPIRKRPVSYGKPY